MRLTKHHGLGNDFLVLLDDDGTQPIDAACAQALCDRRRGIGADGVIRATRPVPDGAASGGGHEDDVVAVMALTNADGTPAEMSGNGIRCLAQALLVAGWATGPDVAIRTVAGRRVVTAHEPLDAVSRVFSVDMGPARLGGDAPEWAERGARAGFVEVGNPHLVVETTGDDADGPACDLVELGERVNAKVPGGINVHLLSPEGAGIAIRTYERGVGPTDACGTGASAAAVAAHAWGLVGERVRVRMPGGTAEVLLGAHVTLRGPTTAVGTVEVPCRGADR